MSFLRRIIRPATGIAWLLAAACHDGGTASGPSFPSQVRVVAGSTQTARVNDTLPALIRFLVTDELGSPVAGVKVKLVVTEGEGDIPVPDQLTRADGSVVTTWSLGPINGVQSLEARVKNLEPAVVTATATGCDLPECPEYDISEGDLEEMTVATYDMSSQVVHPDVLLRPAPSGPQWFWMAITPYPNGNSFFENPSMYRSNNGKFWRIPKGLVNPIAWPSDGYLSDPDIIHDPETNAIWLYYRLVALGRNLILVKRSQDGITWGAPDTVLKVTSHSAISPAVVRGAPLSPWSMWTVDAGPAGCGASSTRVYRRNSTDGLHWSAPQPTDLGQEGKVIWHLDVTWVPARAEYWALYTTYDLGMSCATTALYLATSPDGITWDLPTAPIYQAGSTPIYRDVVYRSTLMTSTDGRMTTLWLSGANYDTGGYHWKAARVHRRTDDLLRISHGPPPARLNGLMSRWLPPPEPYDLPVGN